MDSAFPAKPTEIISRCEFIGAWLFHNGALRPMNANQKSVSTSNSPGLDTGVESFYATITLGDQPVGTIASIGASRYSGKRTYDERNGGDASEGGRYGGGYGGDCYSDSYAGGGGRW